RRARFRLLPPQQAGRMAGLPSSGHRVRTGPLPARALSRAAAPLKRREGGNELSAPLPAGGSVGHWADNAGQTGCTVLLVPDGAAAGVDVRGGAPGTINTDGLRPGTVTQRAHAILLTGGSTFGLSAASGVLRYLEERGIGLMIGSVAVPIVAGAVIFDLLAGDPMARPGPEAGYGACEAATTSPPPGPARAPWGQARGRASRRPAATSRAPAAWASPARRPGARWWPR